MALVAPNVGEGQFPAPWPRQYRFSPTPSDPGYWARRVAPGVWRLPRFEHEGIVAARLSARAWALVLVPSRLKDA
jgi:hypothetical protein